jgi:nucleoside-diphosphate-sugar epimerase
MRALVTGGSGFLGSHLVDECVRRGDRVRVLVRRDSDLDHLRTVPGLEFAYGDLSDPASLHAATQEMDVVYHSAGRVRDFGTRAQFWSTNVDGTERLLAAARHAGVRRFIYLSSPSAVMSGEHQLDLDESAPYPDVFLNLYCASKAVAEQAVLAGNGAGMLTCAIRPRAVWGPRDRTGFLPRLITKLVHGTLPDLSGRQPVFASLCYCVNAALACRLAADSDQVGGRVYFVTDAERSDVWALIAQVAELFGARPPTRRVPLFLVASAVSLIESLWRVPALARRQPPISRYGLTLLTRSGTYDTSAAARDFGYAPRVNQHSGLLSLKLWVDRIGGVPALVRAARR